MDILVQANDTTIMPMGCPFHGCKSVKGCDHYSYTCGRDKG